MSETHGDAIRHFSDIPYGATFADKYGRIFTSTSPGSARAHQAPESTDEYWIPEFDTSREYFEMTQEELEDDPFVFDTWPYYLLNSVTMPAGDRP